MAPLTPSPALNGTAPIDDSAFERPLFQVFAERVERNAADPAVDDGTIRLSYRELHDHALVLGARIAAATNPDALVGIVVPNSAAYPIAWFACLAARRAFLPLDPHTPPARNRAIAAEVGISAAVVPGPTTNVAFLPPGLPLIPITAPPGPPPPALTPDLPPAEIGCVLGTSGSTGRPKGITLHERSLLRKAAYYQQVCDLGPTDRCLPLHAPATFAGSRETFAALLSGACLHVLDLKQAGLGAALSLLRHGGITLCATLPVLARAMATASGAADAFRNLRVLRLGGDSVLSSDIDLLRPLLAPTVRILVGFGMAEAGGALFQRLIEPGEPIESGRIAVGTAPPGQRVTVEDAAGNQVAAGELGVLVIRGRYVALGNFVAGRLDSTAFPADPADPTSRCFRSGDRFLLRQDGGFVPMGRADRQVKINGMRVEPGDLEAALRARPNVADAAVLVRHDTAEPRLVAFIVPVPDQDPTELVETLRAALAAALPAFLRPTEIRLVPTIPLLPSLKPDLAALHDRVVAPQQVTRGPLARAWAGLRGSARRQRSVAPR